MNEIQVRLNEYSEIYYKKMSKKAKKKKIARIILHLNMFQSTINQISFIIKKFLHNIIFCRHIKAQIFNF